jgi:hypothetical protein
MNPSTPNSHVAILAKNFGIPFYYEGTAATREELLSLAGREVMLRTSAGWGINSSASGSAKLVALEDDLPESFRQAVADYKAPPELEFKSKDKADTYTLAMNQIKPSDSELVGGKAAKFSLLRKLIPENSPDPAIAITFDLLDEFMAHPSPYAFLTEKKGTPVKEERRTVIRVWKAGERDLYFKHYFYRGISQMKTLLSRMPKAQREYLTMGLLKHLGVPGVEAAGWGVRWNRLGSVQSCFILTVREEDTRDFRAWLKKTETDPGFRERAAVDLDLRGIVLPQALEGPQGQILHIRGIEADEHGANVHR